MSDQLNRVRFTSATTGTGASVAVGSAYSSAYMTPDEAGAVNGRPYTYIIIQGNDFEIQDSQVYTTSGATIARGTPTASKISGVVGTTKITLDGTQQITFGPSGADLTALRLLASTTTTLSVGVNGVTNPTFQVVGGSSFGTGLKVTGAAAASGVALAVITSGTNENLTIDAAGSGTITFGGTSTGAITLTRATTLSAAFTYGGVTLSNAVTGTGNMVLSASPTLTGTISAAALTLSGVLNYGGVALSAAVTGTGNMVLSAGPTFTGTLTASVGSFSSTLASTAHTITSASANALAVGRLGATTPAFNVDASTATSITGFQVKSAATGGGVALSAIGETNVNLTIDAAGSGTITFGGTSTGAIIHTRASTFSAAITYGGVALSNAVTGTGNMVLSAGPTFTGTISAAALTLSGVLNYGGVALSAAVTGTGNMVLSASPTFTGTLTASIGSFSSTLASTAHTITSASATALTVGLNGATNPAFTVDASTGSQAAGFKITGAATGGTVALVATDSGADTSVTFNAKGAGTIGIGSVSTGRVTITPVTTITGSLTLSAALIYGGVTLSNAVTGTGNMVLATSPTLTTPALGVATATSINGNTFTTGTYTLTGTAGKTLTFSNTLTLAGTDATTMTFPGASANIGYLEIPQNSKSAAYTTVLADSGKHILHPAADTTARTFTIDSNANVAYAIGTAITFVNQNAGGVVTIAITTDTMRLAGAGTTGSRTLAANGVATAIKITSTEWIISGTGLT